MFTIVVVWCFLLKQQQRKKERKFDNVQCTYPLPYQDTTFIYVYPLNPPPPKQQAKWISLSNQRPWISKGQNENTCWAIRQGSLYHDTNQRLCPSVIRLPANIIGYYYCCSIILWIYLLWFYIRSFGFIHKKLWYHYNLTIGACWCMQVLLYSYIIRKRTTRNIQSVYDLIHHTIGPKPCTIGLCIQPAVTEVASHMNQGQFCYHWALCGW